MCNSISAVNELRNECGMSFKATVIVTYVKRKVKDCVDCDIFIGHGHYIDHNMPYIQIEWPQDKDDLFHDCYVCEYVKIKKNGKGAIIIYASSKNNEEIEIDVIGNSK